MLAVCTSGHISNWFHTHTHTRARARVLKKRRGGEEHLLYETFSFHLALNHQIFNYVGSNMD